MERLRIQDAPDFMSIDEVAALLSVSSRTARKLVKRGDIPSTLVGRQYRVPKARLIAMFYSDPQ